MLSNIPVTNVCWFEAEAYCNWLNTSINYPKTIPGWKFRLPTEAEWVYAATLCNIGITRNTSSDINPHPIGLIDLSPEKHPIWDLFGNIMEWCLDVWNEAPAKLPSHSPYNHEGDTPNLRVIKGGDPEMSERSMQIDGRLETTCTEQHKLLGFRVVFGRPLQNSLARTSKLL